MKRHTPGPWNQETLGAQLRAVKISGEKARRIMVPGGPAIAYLPQGREDIQEANAHLIAAAPDMLEALKAAVAYDDVVSRRGQDGEISLDPRAAVAEGEDLDSLYFDWINKSREAIAKAEGSK